MTPTPHPDSMFVRDALRAVLVLAEWTPPLGVVAIVSCSVSPDFPDMRRVSVTLSASESNVCLITVLGMPDEESLDALTKAARMVLASAWDEPACVGIGPAPASHPLLDTTGFGKDC
jgi:hypothetical protein